MFYFHLNAFIFFLRYLLLTTLMLQSIKDQINEETMQPWLFIFSSGSDYDESFLELKKISALVPHVEVILLCFLE